MKLRVNTGTETSPNWTPIDGFDAKALTETLSDTVDEVSAKVDEAKQKDGDA